MPRAAIRMTKPAAAPPSPLHIQAGTRWRRASSHQMHKTRHTSIPALPFSLSQPARTPASAMPTAMRGRAENGCCR